MSVIKVGLIAVVFSLPLRAQSSNDLISDSARAYLDGALSMIESNAYYADRVAWIDVTDSCYAHAMNANSPKDTYEAIRFALRNLNDHHSKFITPEQMQRVAHGTVEQSPKVIVQRTPEGIGYICMPGFSSLDQFQIALYATSLSIRLDSIARTGIRGWILDLRRNSGGNMWPMLAGLCWFLRSDSLGAFVYRNGGKVWWGRPAGWPPPDSSIADVFSKLPLGVLQSDTTASSGEAILLAVRGRPNTRTFGRASSGRTSGNVVLPLPDGAAIVLTTSLYADRFGRCYGQPIYPDVAIQLEGNIEDGAYAQAVNWVLEAGR